MSILQITGEKSTGQSKKPSLQYILSSGSFKNPELLKIQVMF